MICSKEGLNQNLCIICEKGYYPIYYLNNLYLSYLNCSFSPEGFYYDNETSVYKFCYLSCKKCNISGNETEHNCIECKKDYNYEIHFEIYKNCYDNDNCIYYFYFDANQNISFCTNKNECPKDYDKLIEEKKECIANCTQDEIYKYEFKKKCFKQCPSDIKERRNTEELKELILNEKYFCEPICNKLLPFEIIYKQECVSDCDIEYSILQIFAISDLSL